MSTQPLRYSTIIIGSGFGGSVAASTLADAGENTLLLERGPWRDTEAARSAGIHRRAPFPTGWRALTHMLHRIGHQWLPGMGLRLFRRGLFDIHIGKDMTTVCSNSVGGGSHVYSAMNSRPEKSSYWNGRSKGISAKSMDPHYTWMLNKMGAKVATASADIPNWTPNAFAHSPHFVADESVPQPAMSIRMNGNPEDYCNNSFFGSTNGAKATLDQVLLLPAIEKGLQVAAEHECLSLWALPEGGYRLEVMDHVSRRRRYLLTDRVVLAAGTLNTLRLLFHSRAIGGLHGMPALGKGFGGNGDSVAWWALSETATNLSHGTPTHGRFALRNPATGHAQPGPNLTRYGFNGFDALPLPRRLRARLRHDAILVGMGADAADGVASWHRGRLRIRYLADNSPVLAEIQKHFAEVALRSKRPVRSLPGWPLTVHPLGGARLGANEDEGVVDSNGQVYGLPELYIVDAAALPAAPGTPPSISIAAWSRHVALKITAQRADAVNDSTSTQTTSGNISYV